MDEVPAAQRPLLPFDHQDRLAREDHEVLLVLLPVVHRHHLARVERDEVHADLAELRLAFEVGVRAASLARPPGRLVCVDDEPALALGDETVLRLLEPRLRNHRRGG